MQYYEGVGRRKRATARVRVVMGGTGTITVNDRKAEEYFPRPGDLERVLAPLRAVQMDGRVNMTIHILGGGQTGQAGAACHGVARALLKYNEELRSPLRQAGYLTRDDREKERKKPGLKRARKRPTFTKR